MRINPSELILNKDGSIYHLNLQPEDIADTIITVGDPDRVDEITGFFDSVRVRKRKREFHTQTGVYKGKEITVISTGIGSDNIDIVLNELDALVNIDLEKRMVKDHLTSLDIIRIGTSGAIQPQIKVDGFVISRTGIGFDNLLHFYDSKHIQTTEMANALKSHLDWENNYYTPYAVDCDDTLYEQMQSDQTISGITVTNVGFYGPQSRVLRLPLADVTLKEKLTDFKYQNRSITNLEMETSAIYGLSKLLGHRAISMNAILANRSTEVFSNLPKKTVERLIIYTLNKIITVE